MSTLSRAARDRIRNDWRDGVAIAGYIRHYSGGSNVWSGDRCGCPDDRCIGHHHDELDECGCLEASIDAGGYETDVHERVRCGAAGWQRAGATAGTV